MKDSSANVAAPDADLVSRAQEGDAQAMGSLIARHHASVYRVALGILREEEGARDVAQDTFLKAFRGLEGFRGEASFKTWVLTIAANEARGILRKKGRRKELNLEAAGPVAAPGETAEEALGRSEEAAGVRRLLAELPEKQREAVTLRVFEGLSFREIGALIDSSEGAARVNYHHGIKRLREMLG